MNIPLCLDKFHGDWFYDKDGLEEIILKSGLSYVISELVDNPPAYDLIEVLKDIRFTRFPNIRQYHIILKMEEDTKTRIVSYHYIEDKPYIIQDGIDVYIETDKKNEYGYSFSIIDYDYYKNGERLENIRCESEKYYIGDRFVSNIEQDAHENFIEDIEWILCEDKIYPWLLNFIESNSKAIVIDKEEDKIYPEIL